MCACTHTHTHNATLHIPSTKPQCLPYSRYSIHTHPMSKPFKEQSVIPQNVSLCSHFQLTGGQKKKKKPERKYKDAGMRFFIKSISFSLGVVFYFESYI